jgi:hypothetical protein
MKRFILAFLGLAILRTRTAHNSRPIRQAAAISIIRMNNILKNSALMLVAIILSLGVAEGALRMEGRYRDLASQMLIPSPAIYDRPANQIEFDVHPDLNVVTEIRFDRDGVRNHSEPSTRDKRNIIGFFGDSFVENRRIEDSFSFTSLLDAAARPGARVVNYGVDGYGLDQEYLRYKKYEKHDIRDVVYVFCENDLRNLYETGLTEITPSDIVFGEPRINYFSRFIGRLRLTYLVISAYYQLDAFIDLIRSRKWQEKSVESLWMKEDFMTRYHDQYADTITTDFLSHEPSASTLRLSNKFLVLLDKWKREVEAFDRTFTVLVLPWKLEDEVATKLLHNFKGSVIHSIDFFKDCENCRFKNDGHWNEYGNERVTQFILTDKRFPFHDKFKTMSKVSIKNELDEYYDEHLRGHRRLD